ncbi:MAG: hypothetical protein ABTQ32_02410 [Myxococcaceae bacterium]
MFKQNIFKPEFFTRVEPASAVVPKGAKAGSVNFPKTAAIGVALALAGAVAGTPPLFSHAFSNVSGDELTFELGPNERLEFHAHTTAATMSSPPVSPLTKSGLLAAFAQKEGGEAEARSRLESFVNRLNARARHQNGDARVKEWIAG